MYRIIGADEKEYGPVTADDVRTWIAGGRASGQTLARLDDGAWKPLSAFPEFAGALGAAASLMTVPPMAGGSPEGMNGMAVAGLVMGLLSITLGIFCCLPFIPVLGIIFSAIALSQLKKTPGLQSGRGMAIAGLILSLIGLMFSLFLLMMFGFFGLLGQALSGGGR